MQQTNEKTLTRGWNAFVSIRYCLNKFAFNFTNETKNIGKFSLKNTLEISPRLLLMLIWLFTELPHSCPPFCILTRILKVNQRKNTMLSKICNSLDYVSITKSKKTRLNTVSFDSGMATVYSTAMQTVVWLMSMMLFCHSIDAQTNVCAGVHCIQ